MGLDERLSELGIELPPAPQPVASYLPVVVSGGFAFVAGQIAREADGTLIHPGQVGADVDVPRAQQAARICALQALSALRAELGGFDRLVRIVKVEVFVASAPGFTDQPSVANGASDLFAEVLGAAGTHARAAVGVVALPLGASVELTLIAEVS